MRLHPRVGGVGACSGCFSAYGRTVTRHRLKFAPLLVVLGFGLVSIAFTQERQFPQHNCAVILPEGWQEYKEPSPPRTLVAAFAKADKSRLFSLIVNKDNVPGLSIEEHIDKYERSVRAKGQGPLVSGKIGRVAGIKAYERVGKLLVNGREHSSLSLYLSADGKLYSLQCVMRDGDAATDPEIRQCLNGFRFLRTPVAPSVTSSTGRANDSTGRAYDRSRSLGYQIGYRMGQLTPIAVVIAVVMLLVSKKKSSRSGGTPPPLPPPQPAPTVQTQIPPPPPTQPPER